MLQECSCSASRNGAVQKNFLAPSRNIFAERFVKSEWFLAALREHIIFNVKQAKVRKMSEVFWAKLIVKYVIFFARFYKWFWDFLLEFLLENLKLKKKLWWCLLKCLDKYKNVLGLKKYPLKKNSKLWDLESFIFWPKFCFLGDCCRAF